MSGSVPDIHQAIVDRIDRRQPFALAIVLQTKGSAPCKSGAKAIIDAAGQIEGTIGGGQLEAQAQRLAVEAIRSRRPLVFDFSSFGTSADDTSPICGGSVRILIDPSAAAHREAYAQAARACRDRERGGTLLTTFRKCDAPQVDVQFLPPGSSAARPADEVELLSEVLAPPPLLLIAGGGHVGQALALEASRVDFQVVVVDDRREFADPTRYPETVTTRHGDIVEELAAFPGGDDTYIAIVTRGHGHDRRALAACIHKPMAYIGMIGSRRKVALLFDELLASGTATQEQLARVHAPIGLDIGAETVPEIAVSIVAELIAVRRGAGMPSRKLAEVP